jgi:hypothetical protein
MARLLTVLTEREKLAIDLDKQYLQKKLLDQIKKMEELNKQQTKQ